MAKKLPGEQQRAIDFAAVDHSILLDQLGVELPTELLMTALTHRSYSYEHDQIDTNERLEFLGDSVLGLTVAEALFTTFPDRAEGELSPIRASIVNTYSLADIARGMGTSGLGEHILLGRGEELTGGRDKDSILADTTEALFGAVYLTHGHAVAQDVILRLCADKLRTMPKLGKALDWKTSLQEQVAEMKRPAPVYHNLAAGPDHAKLFCTVVAIDTHALGTGQGRTKRESEQHAAEEAFKVIAAGGHKAIDSAVVVDEILEARQAELEASLTDD